MVIIVLEISCFNQIFGFGTLILRLKSIFAEQIVNIVALNSTFCQYWAKRQYINLKIFHFVCIKNIGIKWKHLLCFFYLFLGIIYMLHIFIMLWILKQLNFNRLRSQINLWFPPCHNVNNCQYKCLPNLLSNAYSAFIRKLGRRYQTTPREFCK